MEFGFGLHVQAPLDTPANIRAVAVRGEELGYDYIGFPDHIVMPRDYASVHPYTDVGRLPGGDTGDFLDQLTAMTYVAAVTTKARVMTSVMVVPHRPAVMTAKMLATMDVLSEGRVTVACGAGWLAEEFEALGRAAIRGARQGDRRIHPRLPGIVDQRQSVDVWEICELL